MKIGDLVYVPSHKAYGYVHEMNWSGDRIKSVRLVDEKTGRVSIIEVLYIAVEAVTLIERLVVLVKDFWKKLKGK